jgi:ABC-type multidrug transport system fused ATPase/permease subunit
MIRTQGVLNIYTDDSTIDTGVRKTALDILVDNVSQSCLFMAFNGTGMLIFGYISLISFYYLCERQIHRIRKIFLQKVLKQDMEWFDYNESGAISHKMTRYDKLKAH